MNNRPLSELAVINDVLFCAQCGANLDAGEGGCGVCQPDLSLPVELDVLDLLAAETRRADVAEAKVRALTDVLGAVLRTVARANVAKAETLGAEYRQRCAEFAVRELGAGL